MFKSLHPLSVLFLCLAGMAQAEDHLLYFEAQGIAGYSSELKKGIFYSQNPDAEMQKPSLGFDYIKRFSGESGDVATFALQGRLASIVDPEKRRYRRKAGAAGIQRLFEGEDPGALRVGRA